jgi:hypothetical protein
MQPVVGYFQLLNIKNANMHPLRGEISHSCMLQGSIDPGMLLNSIMCYHFILTWRPFKYQVGKPTCNHHDVTT